MDRAMRNVYMLARRENRKHPSEAWGHIIRFCHEAGLRSSVLRWQPIEGGGSVYTDGEPLIEDDEPVHPNDPANMAGSQQGDEQ